MAHSKKLEELRNLGPASASELNRIGISTLDGIVSLGIEDTFQLLLVSRKASGKKANPHATMLYALYGAVHDIDWRSIPEEKKQEFKELAAELRRRLS